MTILDIFSWLPEKELSLEEIENIVKDIENGKIEEAPKENIPQEDKKQEEKSERSGSPSYNKILEDILEWPFNFFD